MDNTTGVDVIKIPHPLTNHYGGEMHFGRGADVNNLYISVGDGGDGNDPNNNAQDPTRLLGKMLRITPGTNDGDTYSIPSTNPFPENTSLPRNEVYAIGLRNPFRWSFDSSNGDMWIGDVGQNAREEIDYSPAATSSKANFAWRCYEGAIRTPLYDNSTYTTECGSYSNYAPKYSYDHSLGTSVIGGVVYRGTKFPAMAGYYIGSDHYSGIFHVFAPSSNSLSTMSRLGTLVNISDFGESEDGEIFAVALTENSVYRIIDNNVPLPVNLAGFSGNTEIEGVQLQWKTTREEHFERFEIEHSSDASRFSMVGMVESQDKSNGSSYQFTHATNALGLNYYRLKMIDKDHSYAYSRIIGVDRGGQELSFVRPSIVTNGIMNLNLSQAFKSMELVNQSGTSVLNTNLSGKIGSMDVPVNKVAAGLYIVRLVAIDQKISQQKIIIVP
jgi:hypothetical protein